MEERIFSLILSGMKKLELMCIHCYALSRCRPYGETMCKTKSFNFITFTQRREPSHLIGCAIFN